MQYVLQDNYVLQHVYLVLGNSKQVNLEDKCLATMYAGLLEFAIFHFGRNVNFPGFWLKRLWAWTTNS